MAEGAFEHRSGRVISLARLSLAAVFLVAIWADPSQPSRYAAGAYVVLAAYLAASAGYLALTWNNWWLEHRLSLVAHVFDILLFGVMVYLTEGYTSPFYTFFVFLILSATIRWGWKETAATALIVVLLFSLAGIAATRWSQVDSEITRIVVRGTYLIILSLLLIWFSLNQRSGLLQRLAGYEPAADEPNPKLPVREGLKQAVSKTGARRGALLWWDEEEPWMRLAMLDGRKFEEQRWPPDHFGDLVDPRLANRTFLFDASKGRALARRHGHVERFTGITEPISPRLRQAIGCDGGLGIPVRTETHAGLFVLCDIPGLCADDLQVGESLGEHFTASLQQSLMLGIFEAAATNRTRLAISRDLHDTIVQLLAGTALRLQGIRRAVAAGRDVDDDLETLQDALLVEQQGLRTLIGELRSRSAGMSSSTLRDGLVRTVEQGSRQWGIKAEVLDCPAPARTDIRLQHEINQLVREAIANAAKHGGATEVALIAEVSDGILSLALRDNGSGFADAGGPQSRPRSLMERVVALGGSVQVDSTSAGATVTVRLPWDGES